MELSREKHEACLAKLQGEVVLWNQQARGACEYEVKAGGPGRFLFYKKNPGSEEGTQIATIHLTGASGTMRQNPNASKDLEVLKKSAWEMCSMLNESNPTDHYKLTFTGPDAEAIEAYVQARLQEKGLTNSFTLVVGGAQPARPGALEQSAPSAASASSAASQEAVAGHYEEEPPVSLTGF